LFLNKFINTFIAFSLMLSIVCVCFVKLNESGIMLCLVLWCGSQAAQCAYFSNSCSSPICWPCRFTRRFRCSFFSLDYAKVLSILPVLDNSFIVSFNIEIYFFYLKFCTKQWPTVCRYCSIHDRSK